MTTKFIDITDCLQAIVAVTGVCFEDVKLAYDETRRDVHIGWPHSKDAVRFEVGEHSFAISDLDDGKDLWFYGEPDSLMYRV